MDLFQVDESEGCYCEKLICDILFCNSNHPTDSPSEVLWRLEFVQNLAEDIKTATLEDDKLENCTIH